MRTLFLLLLGLCLLKARAEELRVGGEEEWLVEARPLVRLPVSPLLPGSLQVEGASGLLREGQDYSIDVASASLRIHDSRLYGSTLRVRARALRLLLPPSLSLHPDSTLPRLLPGSEGDSLVLAPLPLRDTSDEGDLRYSGSFLRGITVGNGGSVGIESGLQLKVDGRVGRNINVEAWLSDSDSPIQPEGNSQSLEEIDRIHVKVWSPSWHATMGDFDLDWQGGHYLDYRRTVDGIEAGYSASGDRLGLFGAIARGRTHRLEFRGLEGVQGPWQLRSQAGEENILVLAGSEQVWVDGVRMRRGEDADYTIDYGLGRVHFTQRRGITADSRILVEYQYSERLYNRRLAGARAGRGGEDSWLRFAWASESDDPDNPLEQFLSQEDRELLAQAGDSARGFLGSGIREVDPGEGGYRFLGEGGSWGVYEFAEDPPDSLAGDYRWDLRFSELGRNAEGLFLGDYERRFTNSGRAYFVYAGASGGAWAPVIALSPPTSQDVLALDAGLRKGAFRLSLEGGLSRVDENLYSGLDDEDNQGGALKLGLSAEGRPTPLGRPRLRLGGRIEQARFRSFRPLDEIEYDRTWGLSATGEEDTRRLDLEVGLQSGDSLAQVAGAGLLRRGRADSRLFSLRNRFPAWQGARVEHEGSWRRLQLDSLESRRLADRALLEQALGASLLSGQADLEELSRRIAGDEARNTGERHGELRLGLLQDLEQGRELRLGAFRRERERLEGGENWMKHSRSEGYNGGLRASGDGLRGEAGFSRRRTEYSLADSSDITRDQAFLGLQQRGIALDWQLHYRAENALARDRVTQYVQVDSLQGDFSPDPFRPGVFVPDPDGSWVAFSYDTGRERVVASVELESGLRWRPGGPWNLATDTRLEIREQARGVSAGRLYRFDPAVMQGDSSLSGELRLRQDLDWRDGAQGRWRLRLLEERLLDNRQLVQPRKNRTRRLSLRRRWSTGSDTRWRVQVERRRFAEDTGGLLSRDILGHALESEWQQDLPRDLLAGLRLRIEQGREAVMGIEARGLRLDPELEWRSGRKGTLRVGGSWQRALSDAERLPYELLSGARKGTTTRASAEFRYRLGEQTSLSLSWSMDRLPEQEAVHTARAQIQSFF